MKKKALTVFLICVVIAAILGITAYCLYNILVMKTPYTHNLFRVVPAVLLLLGTLIRLTVAKKRNSLDFYEKTYANELGFAFADRPFLRKKLLCACRLFDESYYTKAFNYLFQLLKKARSERDAIPVLLFTALCYTEIGAFDDAIKVYYDLLKLDPKNPQAHSNLGVQYIRKGEYKSAIQHFDASIECKPNHYFAYLNRASCYFRLYAYDNAVRDAEKALEIKNNGEAAAELLCIIYAVRGDEEAKKKYYHIAIASGSDPEQLNKKITHFLNEVRTIEEHMPPLTQCEEDTDSEDIDMW